MCVVVVVVVVYYILHTDQRSLALIKNDAENGLLVNNTVGRYIITI